MFRTRIIALTVALGGLAAAGNAITINVYTSLAPNAYGSPSFAGYNANATYAIEHGLSSYGTGPSAYNQVTAPVDRASVIVTGFNSWLGKADPGTTYGAAYASELGNRMTFGLHILGDGTQFSISQLSFRGTSSGDSNGLGFEYLGGYGYSASYVGINYGADGVKGTADDVYITSGDSTQLVDELIGRGSGNSYAAYREKPIVHTDQELIDMAANDPKSQWNVFTGSYWLMDGSKEIARGSASFEAVPEPFTMVLCAGGLLLALKRRRR